ncbi:MAG: hypothetical protein JWO73_726 [Candidatus Taylorbacteria bacterium]|nr:hypothetical protein [Candidatus Taylorbacteria bacterium]
MIKNFLMKQMVKKQLAGLPQDQQDMIITMIEKNPDFFMKIAHDVQEKVKGGMGQQQAMMLVMKQNEAELKGMMGK